MAFTDDCGEIILDAVLTDIGRKRMAQGTFKITKFAIGDEEIDYGFYDNTSRPPAANDPVMQLIPIIEAIASKGYSLKNNLMTIEREDLEYLPELVLNTNINKGNSSLNASGKYLIIYDKETLSYLNGTYTLGAKNYIGDNYIDAIDPTRTRNVIAVDQGINANDHLGLDDGLGGLSPQSTSYMDGWVENIYRLSLDVRFGNIITARGAPIPIISSTDETKIAEYIIDNYSGPNTFMVNTNTDVSENEVINGPRGSRIKFKVAVSQDLVNNEGYYNQFGSTMNSTDSDKMFGVDITSLGTFKFIDRNIRVASNLTGFHITIPIRFLKKTA